MNWLRNWLGKGDSPSGEVTSVDAKKSLRDVIVFALATGAIAALEQAGAIDMGPYSEIGKLAAAGALSFLRRWVADNK